MVVSTGLPASFLLLLALFKTGWTFSQPAGYISPSRSQYHHDRPLGLAAFPPCGEKDNQNAFKDLHSEHDVTSRRMLFASALVSTGMWMGGSHRALADVVPAGSIISDRPTPSLPWVKDPINPKRSGARVADAEKLGYNLSFVTYLTRFLLNFDPTAQLWWIKGARSIPKSASQEQIFSLRKTQFAELAASVEIGLQEFGGAEGARSLLKSLLDRYCLTDESILEGSVVTGDEEARKRITRESKEARRQLALLFGLLGDSQPTKEITQLLASVDNGSMSSVVLNESLGGFAPSDTPVIEFPPPQAGLQGYRQAMGKPTMKPTGQVLRCTILEPGRGYKSVPNVIVKPPKAAGGRAATAVAKLSSGRISSIEIVDPGEGYTEDDSLDVSIDAPGQTGENASAEAVVEMSISSIQVIEPGSGYAVEKPVRITRVTPNGDHVLIGFGYPEGDKVSFKSFRVAGDNAVRTFEKELARQSNNGSGKVSATSSGGSVPNVPFSQKSTSSQQLLALLPQGFGLEFDTKQKRYFLSVDKDFQQKFPTYAMQNSNSDRPLVPDFGPRGQSPIERDMDLDASTFLRFCLSGAICSSGVHLALTPLDVVKTKVQTNPSTYPKILPSFKSIWMDEGALTFFTGWLPTVAGHFVSGAVLYAMTEELRRSLSAAAGPNAQSLEALIILMAAGIAAAVAAVFYCPFETVRIRVVAQPDYARNSLEALKRMINEEGVESLTDAIPVFLVKNVPYAMVKFTIFDLFTEYLYKMFPAAQEDLILSLGVSLLGGVLGGVSAAVVSNPADAVISELKKAKSDQTPEEALQVLLKRAGVAASFKGLPIRMVFYSLTAAMQFMVFDGVRFALGIGSDDLKLYLDVLGGGL